jgi:hypothetical protein
MQHYKIQQYSFNKNPFLMITQLCSNTLVVLIFLQCYKIMLLDDVTWFLILIQIKDALIFTEI